MAQTLEQLLNQMSGYQPYQPLSGEEIQQQAARRYQSEYDQKRLSAQQSWENEDASLARELSELGQNYDRQRASALEQTRSTYAQADRHALSRGMQRSSYNKDTLANIHLAGDAAQREIDRSQAQEEAQIGEKRTALSRQLSQTLAQLDENQRSDERAYADELAAREYDRSVESRNAYNQLAMKLYEYQHELEEEAAEQARWQAEFQAKYGTAQSSGGTKRTKAAAASQSAPKTKSVSGVRKNQKEMPV